MTKPITVTPDGIDVEASAMLDTRHTPVGVSDFGDDISDHCAVCGYAVGWIDDRYGHATSFDVAEIEALEG